MKTRDISPCGLEEEMRGGRGNGWSVLVGIFWDGPVPPPSAVGNDSHGAETPL